MQDRIVGDPEFRYPVEAAQENLDIEFKRELDLRTPEGKAKLAQEVCALCNHGGGWIVLGRDDNGSYPSELPVSLVGVDQNTVNQAVSAYLTPAPHCSVSFVRPEGLAFDVLVIRVPGVTAIPVCGKKNGPYTKGSITGVRRGVHYVRKSGARSEPIDSPEEWQDVIRRCVLSDRTNLLGALSTMLSRPQPVPEDKPSALDLQFDDLLESWSRMVNIL